MGFVKSKTERKITMKKAKLILSILAFCLIGLLAASFVINLITSKVNATASESLDYYEYAEFLNLVEIHNANDLTTEKLQNRNGKLIIERVVGVVEDAETGAGRVLYGDPEYYYISYASVKGIRNGNIICTYFIYNPDTNYEDDILMRFDYIIDSIAVE